jgi:hypothetical protein
MLLGERELQVSPLRRKGAPPVEMTHLWGDAGSLGEMRGLLCSASGFLR